MRFLVDLYRWLILLALAIGLITATWLAGVLTFGSLSNDPLRIVYVGGLIGAGILVTLGLGVTATFISIHDRLADIAESLADRNDQ